MLRDARDRDDVCASSSSPPAASTGSCGDLRRLRRRDRLDLLVRLRVRVERLPCTCFTSPPYLFVDVVDQVVDLASGWHRVDRLDLDVLALAAVFLEQVATGSTYGLCFDSARALGSILPRRVEADDASILPLMSLRMFDGLRLEAVRPACRRVDPPAGLLREVRRSRPRAG